MKSKLLMIAYLLFTGIIVAATMKAATKEHVSKRLCPICGWNEHKVCEQESRQGLEANDGDLDTMRLPMSATAR